MSLAVNKFELQVFVVIFFINNSQCGLLICIFFMQHTLEYKYIGKLVFYGMCRKLFFYAYSKQESCVLWI